MSSLQSPTASLPLVGHQQRWAALARAFAKDSVPQSLLISGPGQVGKETLVRRYAQLLLCPNTVFDEDGLPAPCNHCRVCHQVEIETFPDYKVFRPLVAAAREEKDWIIAPDALEGSILTVDVARRFGDEAMRRPSIGPRKAMVIVQAERMNIEAQNALLKTFEEPVRGLCIILLADNPNQLLPTVRSRCWHLPLGLAPENEIASWIHANFDGASPEVVQQALKVAQGRPGAAWRETYRLLAQDDEMEAPLSRFAEVEKIVTRIMRSQPVGALGLTEESLRLARLWWNEDQSVLKAISKGGKSEGKSENKKLDAKEVRSATARFLDELSTVYRARWSQSLKTDSKTEKNSDIALSAAEVWADGLDQVRRTRHYILRNANTNLALDVLFGRLISAHRITSATEARNGRQGRP